MELQEQRLLADLFSVDVEPDDSIIVPFRAMIEYEIQKRKQESDKIQTPVQKEKVIDIINETRVYPPLIDLTIESKLKVTEILSLLPRPLNKMLFMSLCKSPRYKEFGFSLPCIQQLHLDEKERVECFSEMMRLYAEQEHRIVISQEGKELLPTFDLNKLEDYKIPTLQSPRKAENLLRYFAGDYIYQLDLKDSLITGPAMSACIFNALTNKLGGEDESKYWQLWIDVFYPGYITVPSAKTDCSFWERYALRISQLVFPLKDSCKMYQLVEGREERGEYSLVPGAPVQILVLEKKRFEEIADKHISIILKHHPRLETRISEGKKGKVYTLVDPEFNIRPVEIFAGDMDSVLTHNLASARAWYQQGTFTLASTAVLAYTTRKAKDYYYFGSEEDIEQTVIQQFMRGFDIEEILSTEPVEKYIKGRLRQNVETFKCGSHFDLPVSVILCLGLEFDLRQVPKWWKLLQKLLVSTEQR